MKKKKPLVTLIRAILWNDKGESLIRVDPRKNGKLENKKTSNLMKK